MQDVIPAELVPVGSPYVVANFRPDQMPKHWAADVVGSECPDLEPPVEPPVDASAAGPSDSPRNMNLEGIFDELSNQRVQACVDPL